MGWIQAWAIPQINPEARALNTSPSTNRLNNLNTTSIKRVSRYGEKNIKPKTRNQKPSSIQRGSLESGEKNSDAKAAKQAAPIYNTGNTRRKYPTTDLSRTSNILRKKEVRSLTVLIVILILIFSFLCTQLTSAPFMMHFSILFYRKLNRRSHGNVSQLLNPLP
jgi:hypothetical protein